MKLQNSYIFLVNPNAQNTKKNEHSNQMRTFDFSPSVYSFISKCFRGSTEYTVDEWYYQHTYFWEPSDQPEKITVIFRFYEVAGATYLDVTVESEAEDDIIKCLEYVHATLHASGVCTAFVMIVSYDAISEFYCNKLYPKLNEIERHLRKLLFNIYTVNFGRDYYRTTFSAEIQSKAKEVIRAKGNSSRKEITVLQEFFYSLEFGDIQEMLFTPRWTSLDEQAKCAFLDEHKDLSILTDAELRSVIADITPKSDWDRFFSDKLSGIDFKGIIESIRGFRNKVAHCKKITKEEYQNCLKMIEQLDDAILKAIEATEDKDFERKNSAYLQKMAGQLADAIQNFTTMYTSMSSKLIQSTQATLSSLMNSVKTKNSPSTLLNNDHEIGDASANGTIASSDDDSDNNTEM